MILSPYDRSLIKKGLFASSIKKYDKERVSYYVCTYLHTVVMYCTIQTNATRFFISHRKSTYSPHMIRYTIHLENCFLVIMREKVYVTKKKKTTGALYSKIRNSIKRNSQCCSTTLHDFNKGCIEDIHT